MYIHTYKFDVVFMLNLKGWNDLYAYKAQNNFYVCKKKSTLMF